MNEHVNYVSSLENELNEVRNLNEILAHCVENMIRYSYSSGKVLYSDLGLFFPGMDSVNPQKWIGKEVVSHHHPEYGVGIIVALTRVLERQYLAGVEFNGRIPKGHSLGFKQEGIPGKLGQCLWLLPSDLNLAREENPLPL